MSKLKELIQNLCPDGVEYKKLGELLDYEQPTKYIVKSTEYDSSYDIPVLTAGQTFVLGYTNEKFGVYRASQDNPTIIFDDFTTSFHWVDFEFKIKSSAMKMLRPKGTFDGYFKYVYYAMKCIKYEAIDHTRHWISKYSQFEIPFPPSEVQKEIVHILDDFTNLAAELQAELQARKEQYEYYRDKLLSFNNINGGGYYAGVTWMKMSDIGTFIRGNGLQKKDFSESGVPCIHYGQIYTYYGTSAAKTKSYVSEDTAKKCKKAHKGDLVIASTSENVEDVGKTVAWLGEEDIAISNHTFIFSHNQNPKYLSYLFQTEWFAKYKKTKAVGVKVIDIPQKALEDLCIPIPSFTEQERIVSILDKFETLVNDLSQGLPAEIAAVQEQYEYYRNKLLSFPRIQISA